MLAKKAGESGMCEADYLRLLISQKPNDYPEVRELLKELINEVNRIGININQIVFNNNAGLYSKEDKTQLVAYMRKLNLIAHRLRRLLISAIASENGLVLPVAISSIPSLIWL